MFKILRASTELNKYHRTKRSQKNSKDCAFILVEKNRKLQELKLMLYNLEKIKNHRRVMKFKNLNHGCI